MKTRKGLVSNSSSTSFLLCTAPEIDNRDKLLEALGIQKDSCATIALGSAIDSLIDAKPCEEQEFIHDQFYCNTWPERFKIIKKLFAKGWTVRKGWVNRDATPWDWNGKFKNKKIVFLTEEF